MEGTGHQDYLHEKSKLEKITGSSPVKNLHYYNNGNAWVYSKYSDDNNITNINKVKLLQNQPKKIQLLKK